MAKRLSDKQKKEIIRSFINGTNIDKLSKEFNCNKLTISRNVKKILGEEKYKDLIKVNKMNSKSIDKEKNIENFSSSNSNTVNNSQESIDQNSINQSNLDAQDNFNFDTFTEIIPLNQEIENAPRIELSSIPISEIEFPKIVYMVVNEKIDLETKLLSAYPQWDFLSESELARNTLEVFLDLKNAKRFCKSNQKVIKVPNTKVFQIVAPILVAKGISRIIFEKNLIAL